MLVGALENQMESVVNKNQTVLSNWSTYCVT